MRVSSSAAALSPVVQMHHFGATTPSIIEYQRFLNELHQHAHALAWTASSRQETAALIWPSRNDS